MQITCGGALCSDSYKKADALGQNETTQLYFPLENAPHP